MMQISGLPMRRAPQALNGDIWDTLLTVGGQYLEYRSAKDMAKMQQDAARQQIELDMLRYQQPIIGTGSSSGNMLLYAGLGIGVILLVMMLTKGK